MCLASIIYITSERHIKIDLGPIFIKTALLKGPDNRFWTNIQYEPISLQIRQWNLMERPI